LVNKTNLRLTKFESLLATDLRVGAKKGPMSVGGRGSFRRRGGGDRLANESKRKRYLGERMPSEC